MWEAEIKEEMTNSPVDFRDSRLLLAEESKDELIDEILKLRQEKQKLTQKNQELEKQLEDLKKQSKPAFIKIPVYKRKKRWKKLGRAVGHPGCTRRKPEVIDHIVEQRLEKCPDCGHEKLSELVTEYQEHIQEDIVPARVEATKFIRHAYWCSVCKKQKTAPYASHEVPYGYLGPNVLVQTILMKYHHGLPYSKIQMMFKELCGLKVTDSALAQALQRLAHWLEVEKAVIVDAVRASPWIHGDETGWKIAGTNHWLWDFVNQKLAVYKITQSRGQKIPEEVLGKDYRGIVLSDFLSAYDKSGKKRQRCLVHLIREMNRCRETDGSVEYLLAYRKLKRILADAKRLDQDRGKLAPGILVRRVNLIKGRLLDFACQPFKNKNWKRLSKRLLKYYEEILTFLEVPGLPQDNNHAERMIRPNVIFRKISFQNMSRKGADAHEVLMSLLQTLRLQNKNAVEFFKTSYLRHRQLNPVPILSLLPSR